MTKEEVESIAKIINNVYVDKDIHSKNVAIKTIVANLVLSFTNFNSKFSPDKFINKCLKDG